MLIWGLALQKRKKKEKEQPKPSLTDAAIRATEQGRDVKASKMDASGNNESIEITGSSSTKVLAEVTGILPNLRQPTTNTCWATAATIMMSWKRGKVLKEELLLAEIGDSYLQLFKNNQPLLSNEKEAFIGALNMVGEPPASYPLQQYIDWVNTYGPLWITTDSTDSEIGFSPHARILVKITGSSPDNEAAADFSFIDPATGKMVTERFADFLKSYEAMVTDNPGDMFVQIVHFVDEKRVGEGQGGAVSDIRDRVLDVSDIPIGSSSFEDTFDFINDHQMGISVKNDNHYIKKYKELAAPWEPITGIRETIKGTIKGYYVSETHKDQDEYDWNITIDLDPVFANKLNVSSNEVLCEVTPSDNFRNNKWFPPLGTPAGEGMGVGFDLQDKELCLYGPWVLDRGSMDEDNNGQEIHPIDAIWWKEDNDLMLMLLQDAAKGRYRKKEFYETSARADTSWKPWIQYPDKEEILIPFIYTPGQYDLIEIKNKESLFIDPNRSVSAKGVIHRLTISDGNEFNIAVEVYELKRYTPTVNLRIDFKEIRRIGSSSDTAQIRGYVSIRIDLGKPANPSKGSAEEEGYIVMKISRTTIPQPQV